MLQSIKYFNQFVQNYWTDENYFGYIYLTYDQKNNKIYIGKKENRIEKTKDYFGSGFFIKKIIKSRGTYFLKKFIIGVCYSKNELNEAEIECIDFFQSTNLLVGYNLKFGGDGGKPTKNVRLKISNSVKKHHDENPLSKKERLTFGDRTRGKTYEEIHGEEKAKELKKRKSEKLIGHVVSIKTKNKISIANKGRKSNKKGRSYTEQFGEEKAKALKEKRIRKLKEYLSKRTEEEKLQYSKNMSRVLKSKESKWMNNTIISKMIAKKDIDIFVQLGWEFGRLKSNKKIN
jgi:hypothetical protein